jgi:hypothetical protein
MVDLAQFGKEVRMPDQGICPSEIRKIRLLQKVLKEVPIVVPFSTNIQEICSVEV